LQNNLNEAICKNFQFVITTIASQMSNIAVLMTYGSTLKHSIIYYFDKIE